MKVWHIAAVFAILLSALVIYIWWNRPAAIPAAAPSNNASSSQTNGAAGVKSAPATTAAPLATETATNTPDGLTHAFYKWYLYEFANGLNHSGDPAFVSSLRTWLTDGFVSQFAQMANDTDQDPVLLAQDWSRSWPAHIATTLRGQTATTAEVLVSLGTGDELKQLHVSLILTSSGWRIASIIPAS